MKNMTTNQIAIMTATNRPPASFASKKLSVREGQILELVSKGLQNKEVANHLSISSHTVHVHLRNIYDKLQVNSRLEAVMKMLTLAGQV